jgi:hypothetical protein
MKSHEIFKLNSLNHIIIKGELYRAQTGLTQRYNCQNFGHDWANLKQPPTCFWCSRGHLHRECPEKTNTESMLSCCNWTLVEGQKPHPVSYRGCSHSKEEPQRRKAQAPKGILWGDVLLQLHLTRAVIRSCTAPRGATPANHRHGRHMGKAFKPLCSSICHNGKFHQ